TRVAQRPCWWSLEDPMSGLDLLGRREFRDLILQCKDKGQTVVFSSHILPDVELICDRVCVLANGRIARSGSLDDLLAGEEDGAEIVAHGPSPLLLPPRFAGVSQGTQGPRVPLDVRSAAPVDPLVAPLLSKEYRLIPVTPRRRSLESVVLEAAGETNGGSHEPRRRRAG